MVASRPINQNHDEGLRCIVVQPTSLRGRQRGGARFRLCVQVRQVAIRVNRQYPADVSDDGLSARPQVLLTEVGPRDGLQDLTPEPSTRAKIRFIEDLAKAGLSRRTGPRYQTRGM